MKHVVLLAATLLARASLAQPTRALPAPDLEFPNPFSSVTGVRELSDGRLVVVDRRERSVFLVDFVRRASKRIGREGAGPREIAQPANILRLPGDTTAIWDGRNARLFFIDTPGAAGRAIPLAGDDGRPITTNLQAPRFADALGRIYFSGVPTDDSALPDSIPILRLDRRTAKLDTVGMLKRPKGGDQATIGPPGRQMTMNFANPFSPGEAWIVTPEGRVGVLRSPEYRLDWTHPAKVRGSDVPFEPLPVTEAEKAEWRRSMQRAPGVLVADAGARAGGAAAPPVVASIPEPTQWPKIMPPFLLSATVQSDDLGRVWVPRARAHGDTIVMHDVFDAASRVVMRVRLPVERRIVGFGKGVVYTVRADEDDLLHLGRHALPR